MRNGIDYATGTYSLIVDTKWWRCHTYAIKTQSLLIPNVNRCARPRIFMCANWRACSRSATRPYNNLKTNHRYLLRRLNYIYLLLSFSFETGKMASAGRRTQWIISFRKHLISVVLLFATRTKSTHQQTNNVLSTLNRKHIMNTDTFIWYLILNVIYIVK